MPLQQGAKPGSKGFGQNIRAEEAAGKPQKQAVAIAYSEARRGGKLPKKAKPAKPNFGVAEVGRRIGSK